LGITRVRETVKWRGHAPDVREKGTQLLEESWKNRPISLLRKGGRKRGILCPRCKAWDQGVAGKKRRLSHGNLSVREAYLSVKRGGKKNAATAMDPRHP